MTFAGHDIGTLSKLPHADLALVLSPAAGGSFSDAADAKVLTRETSKRATARRVGAGGSAHSASPDVRRTPALSEESASQLSASPRTYSSVPPPCSNSASATCRSIA